MTKTEIQIIDAATAGHSVFLGQREKTTLLKLMGAFPSLKVEHHYGNCVNVKFDPTIYMGKEPEQYLCPEQINGKY